MENLNYRGKLGEDFTENFLRERKYNILARNYRSRYGEIDIIAEKDKKISFAEVKTRLEDSLAEPLEFVDLRKQKRIILTALAFLEESKRDEEYSFDVYEVICKKDEYFKVSKLKIHRNAFYANEENCKGLNL